ncbi:UNVERIFIED_CONTAM: hypothetical protein HDU68_006460 [Siphonaria sp. JEL0065]|nr:hypothetical protein HDU68_006460 [Siphonaria sp. JEL0065]
MEVTSPSPAASSAVTTADPQITNNPFPVKWAGTSPPRQDGIGSPEHWIDQSEDSKSENESNILPKSKVDHWLHEMAPMSLAEDLALLREDLKALAVQLSNRRRFRRAESDKRYVEFFDSLIEPSTEESAGPDDTVEYATEKAVPRYMVTLKHAETILLAIAEQQSNLHAEEFMSLMEARVHIRDLEAALIAKDEELQFIKNQLNEAHERIASLPTDQNQYPVTTPTELVSQTPPVTKAPDVVLPTPSLPVRSSSEFLPPRASSESFLSVSAVTGIFNKLRRGSMLFDAPSPEVVHITSIPGTYPNNEAAASTMPAITIEKVPLEEKTVSTVSKPIGLPDDPAASIEACGEWFQSADTFDFFISYRVATEARIAMELYFRLKDQRIIDEYGHSRQVRVYWDKECLKKGQDWRDGFVQGLKNSRCILMLVSSGAMEGLKKSNQYADNVLLEWETAVMAGKKSICVPQPVFINDSSKNIRAIDAILKFKGSDECPKFRPEKLDAHKHSAFTTLSSIMQLQGAQLEVSEVSWSIPDLIKALQTFSPLKMVAAAKQCATEASFFKYYQDQKFDSKEFDLEFLTSNDLKEVFGFEKKEGILRYREDLKNLKLSFRSASVRDKTTWNLLASALKENHTLVTMNLAHNDITGISALHEAIRDHSSLQNVLVGNCFDPFPFLKGQTLSYAEFKQCTSNSLQLLAELWKYGKPLIYDLCLDDNGGSMKDEVVPDEFTKFLGKLTGLKSLFFDTRSPSFMHALAATVANNPTLCSVTIMGVGDDLVVAKDKQKEKEKKGSKNSVVSKRKLPLDWFKVMCATLKEREQSFDSGKSKITSISLIRK